MRVLAPMSAGDLIDRITILRIKQRKIPDKVKRANVGRELAALRDARATATVLSGAPVRKLERALYETNLVLWEIEDRLRALEARGEFGRGFVAAARKVYKTNDRRAQLKRDIDEACGSELREEKWFSAAPKRPARRGKPA